LRKKKRSNRLMTTKAPRILMRRKKLESDSFF
jgi:hypothetical protein